MLRMQRTASGYEPRFVCDVCKTRLSPQKTVVGWDASRRSSLLYHVHADICERRLAERLTSWGGACEVLSLRTYLNRLAALVLSDKQMDDALCWLKNASDDEIQHALNQETP